MHYVYLLRSESHPEESMRSEVLPHSLTGQQCLGADVTEWRYLFGERSADFSG
jgi:hypothetical protein